MCDGRIVEGHGDLRPEHIYLAPKPTIIDCIEFNFDFRRLDVLDELGFLDMELTQLGAERVGAQILERYRQSSGDMFGAALLDFYRSYRACVRAKVSALRGKQLTGEERTAAASERPATGRGRGRAAAPAGRRGGGDEAPAEERPARRRKSA